MFDKFAEKPSNIIQLFFGDLLFDAELGRMYKSCPSIQVSDNDNPKAWDSLKSDNLTSFVLPFWKEVL